MLFLFFFVFQVNLIGHVNIEARDASMGIPFPMVPPFVGHFWNNRWTELVGAHESMNLVVYVCCIKVHLFNHFSGGFQPLGTSFTPKKTRSMDMEEVACLGIILLGFCLNLRLLSKLRQFSPPYYPSYLSQPSFNGILDLPGAPKTMKRKHLKTQVIYHINHPLKM